MIVVCSEEVGRHLVHALVQHCRWLRDNGMTPPTDLAVLLDTLSVRGPEVTAGRQEMTPLGVPGQVTLLSVQQVAARLGVSVRTVRRRIAQDAIPVSRQGRRVLVSSTVVEELTRRTV